MKIQLFLVSLMGLSSALSRDKSHTDPSSLNRALKDEGMPFTDFLESSEFKAIVEKTSGSLKKGMQRKLQAPFPHPIAPVPPLPNPAAGNSSNSTATASDDGVEGDDGSSGASGYSANPYGSGGNATQSNSTTNGTETAQPSDEDASGQNNMYMASAAILLSLMVVVPLFLVCVFPAIFFPKSDSQLGTGTAGEPADDKGASTIPMVVSDSATEKGEALSSPSDGPGDEASGMNEDTDLEKGTGPAPAEEHQEAPASSFWQTLLGTSMWSKVRTEDDKLESGHSDKSIPEGEASTAFAHTTAETTPESEGDRERGASLDSAIRQYTKASELGSIATTVTDTEDEEDTRMVENKEKDFHLVDESGHSLIEDFSGNGKKLGEDKDYAAVATREDAISI